MNFIFSVENVIHQLIKKQQECHQKRHKKAATKSGSSRYSICFID